MAGDGEILCVFGTRPEAIKLAPVIQAARDRQNLSLRVCITGQHREMVDSLLSFFGITPDDDLDVMRPNQDLTDVTTAVLAKLRDLFAQRRPACVLVQGDTTSVMAAALAAFYAKVPVAHLEAGLRTGDLQSPWPEEMNRRIATLTSALHFCPTESSAANLRREGVADEGIEVTGNTVIDALLNVTGKIEADAALRKELEERFHWLDAKRRLVLATCHRRENHGEPLRSICRALARIVERGDVQVALPVHPNPNVKSVVEEELRGLPQVTLLPPQDYVPFTYLMQRAALVLTDSGGVQEEAPSLGKPVLVMRDTTERPEGVAAGTVKLVGPREDRIVGETATLLDDAEAYQAMASAVNPYGDGKAAGRVVARLAKEFGR